MNLTYNRSDIIQGNRVRQESEERPTTFAEYDGAVDPITPDDMDTTNQRMAGPVGARAMQLMNDPEAIEATNNWMDLFAQSNEGADFNYTKSQQAEDQLYADEKRGIE